MSRLAFLKEHRQNLHQIPECGLACELTASYIEKQLHLFGYSTKRYAQTGVVAFKQGDADLAIAFRSDIDALPILEKTEHHFSSKLEGKMHACGHDGHMSMLLRLAYELKDTHLKKSILFIFQPAEEGPGGAKLMIDEGLFNDYKVEALFGLHLYPDLELGKIGLVNGPMMASSDEIIIDIEGKSSHAAAPQDGMDAIYASTHLIQSYQSIVSRSLNPLDTCVITIGTIQGGEVQNILAGHVQCTGTVRAFSEDVFEIAEKRIKEINQGIEIMFNVKVSAKIKRTYPPVINPIELYDQVKSCLDQKDYIHIKPMMFAEDFSFYQKVVPAFFAMVGINGLDKGTYPLHHPLFDFDEEALITGVNYFQKIIENFAK